MSEESKLKPGEELDALVATLVMGWKRLTWAQAFPDNKFQARRTTELTYSWHDDSLKMVAYAREMGCADCYQLPPVFTPSTSIEAAWEVVEKLLKTGHDVTYDAGPNRDTGVTFHAVRVNDVDLSYAETAPHAICLAALKVVGYD